MKRILFILIFIAVGAAYWMWPSAQKPLQPVEEPRDVILESKPVSDIRRKEKLEVPPPILAPSPVPIQKPQEQSKVRSLPPGIVEFELLKGNWAVTQGDILLGKLETPIDGQRGRFKPEKSVLWQSNVIPFGFRQDFNEADRADILQAVKRINESTVVKLVPVEEADLSLDYIIFVPTDERCASYLGRIGGQQPIFISKNCREPEVLHEIMHALGFVHEQSRMDRDDWVKINWENIEDGYENQFDIAPEQYLEIYRGFIFAFDYQTVMLYSSSHFARKSGLKTIESLTNKQISPSRLGLSRVDIQRIDYIYGKL